MPLTSPCSFARHVAVCFVLLQQVEESIQQASTAHLQSWGIHLVSVSWAVKESAACWDNSILPPKDEDNRN